MEQYEVDVTRIADILSEVGFFKKYNRVDCIVQVHIVVNDEGLANKLERFNYTIDTLYGAIGLERRNIRDYLETL